MCGHATLASAFFLFTSLHPKSALLRFDTLSGRLTAKRLQDDRIELDFPADLTVLDPVREEDSRQGGVIERIRTAVEESNTLLKGSIEDIKRGGLGWVVRVSNEISLKDLVIDVGSLVEFLALFDSINRIGTESSDITERER